MSIKNHKNYSNAVGRWSYSKLSTYEQCPRQFRHKYIDKLPQPEPGPALARGLDIHEKAEKFVTGVIKKLPKELEAYSDEFKSLKKMGGTKEIDCSFTKDFQPTAWNAWDNVWCISKLDSTCKIEDDEACIIDYKTGKVYDTHKDQSDVYALAGFIHWPHVDYITGEFWYLDQPNEEPGIWVYERKQHFKQLQNLFARRVAAMSKDTKFNIKPSYKCKWCDFNISKGGPCDPG